MSKESERELQEEVHLPNYFVDVNFNGQRTSSPISAIVPTYNRAPHTVEEDSNPLAWCLESLIAQEHSTLDEIVVIDDGSEDHTKDVISFFVEQAKRKGILITSIRNKKNRGSSISRNIGVAESRNDLLMFVDDDCIFDNRMLFGATFTLERLPERAAAVHVPVYHRKRHPKLVDVGEIGVLDLERGIITGNYDGFPREFLSNPEEHLLDADLRIFNPIQIQNLGGVFLAKKREFQEVGGFPENLAWRNSFREETDLALRLAKSGYSLFFTPDPKFSSIHFKYGAPEQDAGSKVNGKINYQISQSNIARIDTGNRVGPVEWFSNVLMSTYVTLARRSPSAAEEYLKRMYKKFVVDNDFAVSGVGTKIEGEPKRLMIYDQAISDAKKFIGGLKTA
ncbi:MAG: glycosyltransferase [Nanoarchaeota archaeon]|nr:glycosyltransferase [Nanoarchaeota archaeon]